MRAVPLAEPISPPVRRFALFEAGFRVFFLLAPLYAACAVVEWVLVYAGLIDSPAIASPTLWHAHEMVFGFAAAGIAGFFLTAVPNWTGTAYVHGLPLMTLAALVAPPLLRDGIGRNAFLLVVLLALWGADLAMQPRHPPFPKMKFKFTRRCGERTPILVCHPG